MDKRRGKRELKEAINWVVNEQYRNRRLIDLEAMFIPLPEPGRKKIVLVEQKSVASYWTADTADAFYLPARPVVKDGYFYFPVRALEALGAKVTWDAKNGAVVVEANGRKVTVRPDSPVATVNGVAQKMPAPPVMVSGRVLFPARFVAEGLGYEVNYEWHPYAKKAKVSITA